MPAAPPPLTHTTTHHHHHPSGTLKLLPGIDSLKGASRSLSWRHASAAAAPYMSDDALAAVGDALGTCTPAATSASAYVYRIQEEGEGDGERHNWPLHLACMPLRHLD